MRLIEADAHVHVYPLFDLEPVLAGLPDRFSGETDGIWLLTESTGCCWFGLLASGRAALPGGWRVSRRESNVVLLESEAFRLWIVAGWQLVSSEGLEVHALGMAEPIPDHRPCRELALEISQNDGVAAFPYGYGKWQGPRLKVLREVAADPDMTFVLSDSAVRPGNRAFTEAFPDLAESGRPIIAGSDPLPLYGEESRIGTYRSVLGLPVDNEDLSWADLRNALFEAGERDIRGQRVSIPGGLRRQLSLRLGGRFSVPGEGAPRHADGGPASAMPDLESSGEDYATRFHGAAGRVFLEKQGSLCLDLAEPWRGGSILDVGGGHAQVAPAFAREGWQVTVAASPGAPRRILEREMKGLDFREVSCDFLHLPFEDNAFDVVLGLRLVTHEPHWVPMLREFTRVARSAVIFDYPDIRSANLLYSLLFKLKKRYEKNTRDYAVLSRKQVRAALAPTGLDLAEIRPQFFFPMVVHRALSSGKWSRRLESFAERLGLVGLFGSPIIVRATRGKKGRNQVDAN